MVYCGFVVMVIFLSQKRIEAEDLPPVLTYNSAPNARYLWNEYLTSPVGQLGQDWILPVIHGFVDQGNVSIYGSPVLLTLIARRSNRYAGTRYGYYNLNVYSFAIFSMEDI